MSRANPGPHLVLNKRGIYEIRWTENGRSSRSSTGTSHAGEAQRVLAHFLLLKDKADRAPVKEAPVTVAEALDEYWREHVVPHVIDKERISYAIAALKAGLGAIPTRSLSKADINAYRARRGISDGSLRRELGTLVAAINHAVRERRISRDDAPTIWLPPKPEPKDRWLTYDEADRLLMVARLRPEIHSDRAKGATRLPRVYRFIVLALATWSRKTALLELRRSQVDLVRKVINLNPPGRVQTRKRRPVLPIADMAFDDIKRMCLDADRDGLEHLLDHPGSIRKAFDTAVEDAGLEGVTPHTLRHTGATWAAQEGVSLFDIAGVLGDSLTTVQANYLHHCPDHLRGAVNAARRAA